MSLTISAPRASAPGITTLTNVVHAGPQLEWELVDCVHPHVWIGRVRGNFVGMVESRGDDGFAVTTRLGRGLGTFSSLELAQDAFIKR